MSQHFISARGLRHARRGPRTIALPTHGFGLIELMIAMLLGLMVTAAAIALFQSNRQTYGTIQGIGRIQEGAQAAFELMARDLRKAGANPCDIGLPVANVVNGSAHNWWTNFAQPLFGLDAGAANNSVPGSDAIQILSIGDEVVNVTGHSGTTLRTDTAAFSAGDVLMVCDIHQLAIFKATRVSGDEIDHARSTVNCSDSLNAAPAPCAIGAPAYVYRHNAVVGRLDAVQWSIRDNSRGATSLFRTSNGVAEEIVEGVAEMRLSYLQPEVDSDDYVDAGAITDWAAVHAVSVALTLTGAPESGVTDTSIRRRMTHVVTLRNRTL